MEIRVLGPLEAHVEGLPVELGGPRQHAVLARLLVARGGVVSVDRLIDDLWGGEPPPRAAGALQAYVSHLRRALEPDRAPRAPAQVLVSVPPGYALRAPAESVDAWHFEALTRRAAELGLGRERRGLLEDALSLWRGAAYTEVAEEPWAVPEAARLEELRVMARERLAEALIATGAGAEAVLDADALTREYPLREESWRLLALALAASGRQGDALAALRRARRVLADELGLDPGPVLTQLEAALLAQDADLFEALTKGVIAASSSPPSTSPIEASEHVPNHEAASRVDDGFVGRQAALEALRSAAESAMPRVPSLVLVRGEAGSGKSALLDRFRVLLAAGGWNVVLGRCPEAEGAPPAWAWRQALRELASLAEPGPLAEAVAPLLADPPSAGSAVAGSAKALSERFRLHQAVVRWMGAVQSGPLAVLLDDVHRADAETLALLRSILELWGTSPARLLIVVTHRPEEARGEFADTLEALARRSPIRIELSGLDAGEASRLIAQVCGQEPDRETVEILTNRTGGNPFYLRESARLLASEGVLVATSEVPQGVRDVLRRRFSRLPELAVSVLRLASVLGRDVDIDVLIAAAEVDETEVLDALEIGVVAGLLDDADGRLRFSHVLVRDALYTDIPGPRRLRWHARAARALEQLRPNDVASLAHHYARSVTAATAVPALVVNLRAAEVAQSRYAYDSAMELYRQALVCMDHVPPGAEHGDDHERIAVLGRLSQAALRRGARVEAIRARNEAVEVAVRSDDDHLLLEALCAWRIPTPWLTRPYGSYDAQLVGHVERLLASALPDPTQRVLLLCLLARETNGEPGNHARAHAEEAVALARPLGDAALLGLALCAAAEVILPDDDLPGRTAVADELLSVATEHGLVLEEAIGHTMARQAACARNDVEAVLHHLSAEEALGRRFQLGPVQDGVKTARAMLATISGRFDEAEQIYREAARTLVRRLGPDGEGVGMLGVLLVRLARVDGLAEMLTLLEHRLDRGAPGFFVDLVALTAARAGDRDKARELRSRHGGERIRPDFLRLLLITVRAAVSVELGERDEVAVIYPRLLPYEDRFAGAGTGSYALCPVASVLGDCAELLGDLDAAARHHIRAADVARRWTQDGEWERRSLAAARRLANVRVAD